MCVCVSRCVARFFFTCTRCNQHRLTCSHSIKPKQPKQSYFDFTFSHASRHGFAYYARVQSYRGRVSNAYVWIWMCLCVCVRGFPWDVCRWFYVLFVVLLYMVLLTTSCRIAQHSIFCMASPEIEREMYTYLGYVCLRVLCFNTCIKAMCEKR